VLDAETRLAEATRLAEDPAIATDAVTLQERLARLEVLRTEVDCLYTRWAVLEQKLK
jgi:ubiquinone biosynthesis protein UbiJ